MRIKTTVMAFVLALAGGATAGAAPIQVGDLAGSRGSWQEAKSVIDAPVADVQEWMGDVAQWPQRFSDVTSVHILGKQGNATTLRFHSKIIGRDLTITTRAAGDLISYDGFGKDVTTQGKIFMRPIDARHTEVILQSTSEVHGALGAFASKGMKRKRAFAKMTSDLKSLEAMAGGRTSM
jgi:uncharacterized membrane protein